MLKAIVYRYASEAWSKASSPWMWVNPLASVASTRGCRWHRSTLIFNGGYWDDFMHLCCPFSTFASLLVKLLQLPWKPQMFFLEMSLIDITDILVTCFVTPFVVPQPITPLGDGSPEDKALVALFTYQFWPLAAFFVVRVTASWTR